MSDDEQGNILIAAPLQHGVVRSHSDEAVRFQILALEAAPPDSRLWRCTFAALGGTSHFNVQLHRAYDEDDTAVPPVRFGEGRFFSVEESDTSSIMDALAKALEAQNLPNRPKRAVSLPFVYTSFGDRLSPASCGGFQTKPAGDWTLVKLFLGENTEEDEGQVFLALNSFFR